MNNNILLGLRTIMMERTSIGSLPEEMFTELSIHNTYGTNAIEGSSMTLDEVRAVIDDKMTVSRKPVQELMETVQHDRAFKGLVARLTKSIDLVTVQELHEEVFHGIMMDAGQWRHVNVVIKGARHRPPSFEKVVPSMDQWLKDYQQMEKEMDDGIAVGTMMHASFERVHPFRDGNGRVGRLLLNLHLMKRNWPPVLLGPSDRKRYLDGLERSGDGDHEGLLRLMNESMSRSLLMVLDRTGTDDDLLRPLKDLEGSSGHSQKYLSLRVRQGELPALMVSGDYRTSRRAVSLYQEHVGRR